MSILFPSYSMGLFSLVIMILSLPLLSLIIRRLHDSEHRGSWVLLIVAPLLIAMAAWTYSYFFLSAGNKEEKSEMVQYDESQNLDIFITPNGDTVTFWPNDLMEAQRTGNRFEGMHNGNPIMIEPSVFQDVKREQRLFYGTAGIVSFLFVFWLIGSIILTVLCASSGTEGPNRYGPDPKAVS